MQGTNFILLSSFLNVDAINVHAAMEPGGLRAGSSHIGSDSNQSLSCNEALGLAHLSKFILDRLTDLRQVYLRYATKTEDGNVVPDMKKQREGEKKAKIAKNMELLVKMLKIINSFNPEKTRFAYGYQNVGCDYNGAGYTFKNQLAGGYSNDVIGAAKPKHATSIIDYTNFVDVGLDALLEQPFDGEMYLPPFVVHDLEQRNILKPVDIFKPDCMHETVTCMYGSTYELGYQGEDPFVIHVAA